MGQSNSPKIFQERMNKFFNELEYIRAFIDALFNISNSNFEDLSNEMINQCRKNLIPQK